MKTALVACFSLVVLVGMSGCSKNKGKLEGTSWSNYAGTVKGQRVPHGVIRLEFRTDGSMVYDVMGNVYTGKYSLGMGDSVTWNLNRALGGRKRHVEKCQISGDMLTVSDSDGTSLSFKKN